MNLLYSIQKELYAAWTEVTCPLFPDSSANDYFYIEQFNYYQSLKGKVIDSNSGESIFSATIDSAGSSHGVHSPIVKAHRQYGAEASTPVGFLARNWKPV